MKIKLDGIDQEITLQQARDIYSDLKDLFEPKACDFSPPFFPEPYLYDPLRVKYGPGTTEFMGVDK